MPRLIGARRVLRGEAARASRDSRLRRERAVEQRAHVDRRRGSIWPVASVSPVRDEVAAAELVGREADAARATCRGGARARRGSAARRSRGTRRAAARWSRRRGRGCGRSGTSYGPAAWMVPRDSTTGDSVAVAPPSMTKSMSIASSVPSRVDRRCGAASATGGAWSSPPCPRRGRRSIFTGRPAFHASSAACAGDHRRVLLLAAEAAAGLRLDDARLRSAAGRRAASAPCGRSTGTASSPRR